jgi:NADH-quinone oxidoreductase subunit C
MSDTATDVVDTLRPSALDALRAALGDRLVGSHLVVGDDLWIRVSRDAWIETCTFVRDRLGCRWFDFLSAIDWLPSPYGRSMDAEIAGAPAAQAAAPAASQPASYETGVAGGETRFQVIARFVNLEAHWGVTIKVDLPDDDLSLPTLIPVFPGANWHEREAHEMFGIAFVGHPDPRPLYLPTDFEGHPLRKDFPLVARMVKPWPGIVDVEQLPGETDDEGEGAE